MTLVTIEQVDMQRSHRTTAVAILGAIAMNKSSTHPLGQFTKSMARKIVDARALDLGDQIGDQGTTRVVTIVMMRGVIRAKNGNMGDKNLTSAVIRKCIAMMMTVMVNINHHLSD